MVEIKQWFSKNNFTSNVIQQEKWQIVVAKYVNPFSSENDSINAVGEVFQFGFGGNVLAPFCDCKAPAKS